MTLSIIFSTVFEAALVGFGLWALFNEDKFIGRGVSYCALCDGNLYKDKVTGIIGGGNSALESAIYLSNICKKVYL